MKKTIIFLASFFLVSITYGQFLQGTVIDSNNDPLIGVNIINTSNDMHTHSKKSGTFTFKEANIGDTLLFTYIGYEATKVSVNSLVESMKVILKADIISLDEIVILPKLNALNVVTNIDIQSNPVNSSQEILQKVPGLFIGQHAGGGKAEQIFLRGFDIDHGTDINISVDGLPVNMVSHAHGQGYADLHFLIPETLDKVDFGKGPYYAHQGNFNTAGYVNFKTKERLKNSSINLEAGQFNAYRLLGIFDLLNNEKHNAYFASEYLSNDGPFESPQNFSRTNLFGKYTGYISSTDKIGITASYFTSQWDASGQVPQRAIDNRSITRFGAIDDTEGGTTSRTNVLLNFQKAIDKNAFIKNNIYYTNYNFELYSNFTFFLNDPIFGDQIRQKENRDIFGFSSEYNRGFSAAHFDGLLQAGINLRNDQSHNNELSHTANRRLTLDQIRLGEINETNFGAYINTTFNVGKWTINPAVRLDYFDFQFQDALAQTYQNQSAKKSILSPKLNILYNQTNQLQWYIKAGKGFHSNDTRVVVAQNGKEILPDAYGADAGFIWKPFPKMIINAAYWFLFLEQEFVYVGDEGIVEPSGKTSRQGVDLSLRYQPVTWLFWNLDANYTYARATEEKGGENYIPLAPDFTFVSGLNAIHSSGLFGGVNIRYLNDRPATEDNSIIAPGYTIVDLNAGYKWNSFDFSFQIQNLLDTSWNETQFATKSRLQHELNGVEEIHFTPGTPFFIKGIIGYKF